MAEQWIKTANLSLCPRCMEKTALKRWCCPIHSKRAIAKIYPGNISTWFFHQTLGHFIIYSSTRIYYALKNPELKCFFLLRKDQKVDPFPPQIGRTLEVAGIKNRLTFISEPTQIEKIIIPEPSYISQGYYSKEYVETFNTISRNITPVNVTPYEKVFSRVQNLINTTHVK